jgi:CubicO group peptidase (beta-lactamase class C family)
MKRRKIALSLNKMNAHRAIFLTTGFSLLAAIPAAGQGFPSEDEIKSILRARYDQGVGGGVVVGILEADGNRRIVSFGAAGPGARALGPESVFEIGSITMVFTGILLADMARRGELGIEDPVREHLPEGMTLPA